MKLLKGCVVFLFSFLFFIILLLTLELLSVRMVLFSAKIPNKIIDEMNFKETGQDLADYANEKRKESPDEEPADEAKAIDDKELKDMADEITSLIKPEEEKQIKTTAKIFVNEFFEFMTSQNKKEIRVDIKTAKDIIIRLAVRSDSFKQNMNSPVPMCSRPDETDCLKEDDLVDIIDKSLSGKLTEEDITNIVPICTPDLIRSSSQCIMKEQVDELLKSNLNRKTDNEGSDETLDFFAKDELVLAEKDMPNGFSTVRSITIKIDLVILLGFVLSLFFAILIILLDRTRGLYKIAAGLIVLFVLSIVNYIILKTQTDYLINKLNAQLESNPMLKQVNKAIGLYSDEFALNVLIQGIILLLVIILLFALGYYLRKKQRSKNIKSAGSIK